MPEAIYKTGLPINALLLSAVVRFKYSKVCRHDQKLPWLPLEI